MNKILIIWLAVLLSAGVLLISILPAAATQPRYPSLDLAPIQIEPADGIGNAFQRIEQCSVQMDSSYRLATPLLLDGSSLFHDAKLSKLTLSPATPLAENAACTISLLVLPS